MDMLHASLGTKCVVKQTCFFFRFVHGLLRIGCPQLTHITVSCMIGNHTVIAERCSRKLPANYKVVMGAVE